MSQKVIAIAAHPDDIEFVMAGTMIYLRRAGFELHYLNIANGCCGSTQFDAATTARVRREEAMQAASKLGAEYHESLVNDLEIFYDKVTLQRLTAIIRKVQPTIVLTHSPQDYMEDHMITSRLAVTAAFARGMPNFPTFPPAEAVAQNVTVYHAQPHGNADGLGQPVVPSLFVDVGAVMPMKTDLLACHDSQKAWLDASQGMDSYLIAMQSLSRDVGQLSGCYDFAEGWRKHSHLGFCEAAADPLREALGAMEVVSTRPALQP